MKVSRYQLRKLIFEALLKEEEEFEQDRENIPF